MQPGRQAASAASSPRPSGAERPTPVLTFGGVAPLRLGVVACSPALRPVVGAFVHPCSDVRRRLAWRATPPRPAFDTWERLSRGQPNPARFDPVMTAGSPACVPVAHHAIVPGTPLARAVIVEMEGHIRLGRWLSFRAVQLHAPPDGYEVGHVQLLTGSLITVGRRLRPLALACAPPGTRRSTARDTGRLIPAPGQCLVVVARWPAGIVGQREVAFVFLGGVQPEDGVQPVEETAQVGYVGVVRVPGRCRR